VCTGKACNGVDYKSMHVGVRHGMVIYGAMHECMCITSKGNACYGKACKVNAYNDKE
jgi:thiamine biosynthesis protein ThiC